MLHEKSGRSNVQKLKNWSSSCSGWCEAPTELETGTLSRTFPCCSYCSAQAESFEKEEKESLIVGQLTWMLCRCPDVIWSTTIYLIAASQLTLKSLELWTWKVQYCLNTMKNEVLDVPIRTSKITKNLISQCFFCVWKCGQYKLPALVYCWEDECTFFFF